MPRGISKTPEETIEKMKKSHLGVKNGFFGEKHSEETKKIFREKRAKQIITDKTKLKISLTLMGEKNHMWKGDEVGYSGIHQWIRKQFGKADHCEHCGLNEIPEGKKRWFDWANKSHNYLRDLTDWLQLCRKCHSKYDNELKNQTNQCVIR